MPRAPLSNLLSRPQTCFFVMVPVLFLLSVLLLLARSPSEAVPSAQPVTTQPAQSNPPSPDPTKPTHLPPTTPPPKSDVDSEKQAAVREVHAPFRLSVLLNAAQAFRRAWKAYKEVCWGNDELRPVSRHCHSWGGFGLTIVDSLDTAVIMELKEESEEGLEWIRTQLKIDQDVDVSTFETTIRLLGGLLSLYSLTNQPFLLDKARQLGDLLLPAFATHSGLPHSTINLKTGRAYSAAHLGASVALSEVGTLSMEFAYLSHCTGDMKYAEHITKVQSVLAALPRFDGLYACHVNRESGQWGGQARVTMGALGDSYYEYLLKMWLLTHRSLPAYSRLYDEAARGILAHMIGHSDDSPSLTYIAELVNREPPLSQIPKMDHLVCFASGMLALGASANPDAWLSHMPTGEAVGQTCVQMYTRQAAGVAPEIVKFAQGTGMYIDTRDKHYLLRPETVEALFVLWRTTGKAEWRADGWRIFQALERSCRVRGPGDAEHGYSGLRDVTAAQPAFDDMQQSFFMAETLKYLYLLFSPSDLIPLDKYVFNTEAHPLPVFRPSDELHKVLTF